MMTIIMKNNGGSLGVGEMQLPNYLHGYIIVR